MRNAEFEKPALETWAKPPAHWDSKVAWWIKALLVVALTGGAFLIDERVSGWALRHLAYQNAYQRAASTMAFSPVGEQPTFWDKVFEKALKGDMARELMFLEQYGQFACSVAVIAAVALLDRRDGLIKALAIAAACLATLAVMHLLKDCFGRSRPFAYEDVNRTLGLALKPGEWVWGGPGRGFGGGAKWTSFPSGHSTSAFALAAGLAWFYPRGRVLFMTLAVITAAQRVLHGAHFVSDVIAGMGIGVGVARVTLGCVGKWVEGMTKQRGMFRGTT